METIAGKIKQLLPTATLINRLKNHYGERSYFYYEPKNNEGLIDPTAIFLNDFNAQISLYSQNMCVMYKGYTAIYDPTANYDMKEEHYVGGSTATAKSKMPMVTTTNTTTEATIDGTDKRTGEVKSETQEIISENFFDSSTNVKTKYDGKDTEEFNTIQKDELKRSGNIGVATVPDMLSKESMVRFTNYLYKLIEKIMDDLTVMVYTGD